MESLGEGHPRRCRNRVTLTIARIVMDGVEFKMAYNQAVNHAERITAPETKQAVMAILQLLNGLHNMVEELQTEEEC